jgi:hypothetical protein
MDERNRKGEIVFRGGKKRFSKACGAYAIEKKVPQSEERENVVLSVKTRAGGFLPCRHLFEDGSENSTAGELPWSWEPRADETKQNP